MASSTITFEYQTFDSGSLPWEWLPLVSAAKDAALGAYSPYSHFSVGAAVLTSAGHVEIGSNQENAAYPSGLCAERTAVFHANAKFPDEAILRLVIVARNGGRFTDDPISPCGSCRQVLSEVERRYGSKLQILLHGERVSYLVPSASSLLPLTFDSDSLEK